MCTTLEELQNKSRLEGRVLTVRIYWEAKGNSDYSKEQIAKKVGCTVQEVEDTLEMLDL